MLKIVGSFLLAFLMVPNSFAGTKNIGKTAEKTATQTDCKEVASDLKAMQKAQQSISESLISNHDTFADLLTDYSGLLSTSADLGKPVTKDAVQKMGESAKSFRTRGQNAEKLNQKLTIASNEVIDRAIACLKK